MSTQAGSRTEAPLQALADVAADEGFPVEVALPDFADGPITLTYAGQRTPSLHFTVDKGRTSATTRARLDELVRLGGRPI